MPVDSARLDILSALSRKVLWLSSWTIHHANHLRANRDGLKVGGHQASSASLATIMAALYFAVLKPEDRVAVKPHASPVFHAIQYLLGLQTRDKLRSEEHTSELQSLMRISYAVFCLKKKNTHTHIRTLMHNITKQIHEQLRN